MLHIHGEVSCAHSSHYKYKSIEFPKFRCQVYTEIWVNSPGQQEDNSWQAFVYVLVGN